MQNHETLSFFKVGIAKKEIVKHSILKTIKLRYCDFEIKGHRTMDRHSRFLQQNAVIFIELGS